MFQVSQQQNMGNEKLLSSTASFKRQKLRFHDSLCFIKAKFQQSTNARGGISKKHTSPNSRKIMFRGM